MVKKSSIIVGAILAVAMGVAAFIWYMRGKNDNEYSED